MYPNRDFAFWIAPKARGAFHFSAPRTAPEVGILASRRHGPVGDSGVAGALFICSAMGARAIWAIKEHAVGRRGNRAGCRAGKPAKGAFRLESILLSLSVRWSLRKRLLKAVWRGQHAR